MGIISQDFTSKYTHNPGEDDGPYKGVEEINITYRYRILYLYISLSHFLQPGGAGGKGGELKLLYILCAARSRNPH